MNDTFELLERDPNAWIEQAEALFLSAKLVQDEFRRVRELPVPRGETRLQMLAFFDSFMMLTAFAFENLIKGVGVAKGFHWKNDFRADGGHGIAKYVNKVINTSAEEDDLLKRLQVFSMWAGRYPMPMNSEKFQADADNRRYSFPKDDELVESLSERLKREIRTGPHNRR